MTQNSSFQRIVSQLHRQGIEVLPIENTWWLPRLAHRRGAVGFAWKDAIYLARDYWWTNDGCEILLHESRHSRDMRKLTLPLYLAIYALLPLPCLLTARAWLEWRGYREGLLWELELAGKVSDGYIEWVASQFSSPIYLWMLPWPGLIRWLCKREIRKRSNPRPT